MQTPPKGRPRAAVAVRAAAAACVALAATTVQAALLRLDYSGAFTTAEAFNLATDASPSFFTAATPFSFRAVFDDASPNLAPRPPIPPPNPFDGFVAYAPTSFTMTVLGADYTVAVADNPGFAVSIFDRNSFVPGRYGVGFIVDAVADGAGIVGDFVSASPDYTVSSLVPTVYGDFAGVGHASGVCATGFPPACPRVTTPLVLRDGDGEAWHLRLATFEVDFPAHPLNTAQISVVPEPATLGLWAAGLSAIALKLRRRRG